jgi:hypothetical protein
MAPFDLAELTLEIEQEIRVNAPVDVTFDALLEQLGPSNERPDGVPLPLKLEPWPGGRWFRDLGQDNGHLWAHVQSINRPSLLEFTGPLFMSYPVANSVQYRLSQDGAGTLIKFRHSAFGLVQEDHRKGAVSGWTHMHELARKRAEASH